MSAFFLDLYQRFFFHVRKLNVHGLPLISHLLPWFTDIYRILIIHGYATDFQRAYPIISHCIPIIISKHTTKSH